nr:5-formyltetrahydrofolate cyclo-ligase [Clostridiales bacterium]
TVLEKEKLRRKCDIMARQIDNEYKKDADRLIYEKFIKEFSDRGESFFVYLSTEKEPDTKRIIEFLLKNGKKVYAPVCMGKGIMKAVRLTDLDKCITGKFGIPMPSEQNEETEKPDIAVIPCVCAGRDRRRLGHGGGYYDRFLKKAECISICLCFEKLIVDDIPVEQHDLSPDYVLTEKLIY